MAGFPAPDAVRPENFHEVAGAGLPPVLKVDAGSQPVHQDGQAGAIGVRPSPRPFPVMLAEAGDEGQPRAFGNNGPRLCRVPYLQGFQKEQVAGGGTEGGRGVTEKKNGTARAGVPAGRLSPQGPAWLPCWFRSRRRSGTGKVRSAGPGTRKPPPKAQRSPAPWKKGPQPMLRSTAIQDSKLMSGRSSSLLRRVYGRWKISRADCVRHCTKRKEGHSLFPGIPVVLSGLIARRPVLCVRSRAGYAERRGNAPWADLVSGIYF